MKIILSFLGIMNLKATANKQGLKYLTFIVVLAIAVAGLVYYQLEKEKNRAVVSV